MRSKVPRSSERALIPWTFRKDLQPLLQKGFPRPPQWLGAMASVAWRRRLGGNIIAVFFKYLKGYNGKDGTELYRIAPEDRTETSEFKFQGTYSGDCQGTGGPSFAGDPEIVVGWPLVRNTAIRDFYTEQTLQ